MPNNGLQRSIPISAGDRWALVGASGTGKTTFALLLLNRLWHFYRVPTFIIDTKPDDKLQNLWRGLRQNEAPRPHTSFAVQRWEPLDKNGAEYDLYLKRILDLNRPCILYVDEIINLQGTGGRYPQGLEWVLKQARSKRITVIIGSQRVAKIPPDVLAQATHIVAFGLRNEYDRRIIASELMLNEYNIQDKYGFYHSRLDILRPGEYYRDSQSFLFGRA